MKYLKTFLPAILLLSVFLLVFPRLQPYSKAVPVSIRNNGLEVNGLSFDFGTDKSQIRQILSKYSKLSSSSDVDAYFGDRLKITFSNNKMVEVSINKDVEGKLVKHSNANDNYWVWLL